MGPCGAKITNVQWTGGWNVRNWLVYLEMSITSPTSAPQAIGHFTFSDDKGHSYRWYKDPGFVNCQDCNNSCRYQANPYNTGFWLHDPYLAPPQGTWFDVWIAIYWDCVYQGNESISCISENIHYRGLNNNNVYPPGSPSPQ
ncbi:13787_t:CDS:2 [Dentiscutata erythropus]|uniref:13787_t:CDS:1 n=1 Tax=Dentiscutata erythropus TaxID=1348616 RepID=A0A9N9AGZ6_9GLOM|nr:13787_t:CDS:2 [Dentiscutata erythropus]